MISFIPTGIFWLVALAYLIGAGVHAGNMLGYSGYRWLEAPLKWQVLDVFYLIVDATVFVGLLFGWRAGLVAFFIAAASQVVLYTIFRHWVLDVPERFLTAATEGSLIGLLVFHAVTASLVFLALWLKQNPAL